MKNNNLSMYGTTAGFKKYLGIIEQVILGQVYEWGVMPSSMFGIGLEQVFIDEIAKKVDMSLEQYMDFYQNKHTRVEFAPQHSELKEIEDGKDGARIELQMNGVFENLTEKKTFWRRRLKHFEADSNLIAKIRNSESDKFSQCSYHGKMIISGPAYALKGFKKFFDEHKSKRYQFSLVSKAQRMAFISK